MKKLLLFILLTLVILSCNSPKPAGSQQASVSEPEYSLTELWRTDTIMRTCESVLFDSQHQQIFVSCINGSPAEKNGKGYIALLDLDGNVKTLEWVSGLDGPKGMGLFGNLLYVADIDQLVVIDIQKAEVKERIPVGGATFLNDIAIDNDGTVYFTDSDTGWIWKYKEGTMELWVTEGLERPNGLFIEESRVLLTSSGSSDLKVIDKNTGTFKTVTRDIGHGDGVEFTGKAGHYIVTSWAGEIFLVLPDFSRISLLLTSDQNINSADIGFNREKQVVYVPTFFDNRVVAYHLSYN
jgi:outer membrane protein assembly factor BamB